MATFANARNLPQRPEALYNAACIFQMNGCKLLMRLMRHIRRAGDVYMLLPFLQQQAVVVATYQVHTMASIITQTLLTVVCVALVLASRAGAA